MTINWFWSAKQLWTRSKERHTSCVGSGTCWYPRKWRGGSVSRMLRLRHTYLAGQRTHHQLLCQKIRNTC